MKAEVVLVVWWLVGFASWLRWLRSCGAARGWMDLASGLLVMGWLVPVVWGMMWAENRRVGAGSYERPVAPLGERRGRVVVCGRPKFCVNLTGEAPRPGT